jgi:putative Holliday junction resolvase
VSARSGRALGVDLGRVRIGLALSDPLWLTAQPLPPLEGRGRKEDVARLAALVREHGVTTVVVGLPLLLSGDEGEQALEARACAAALQRRLGAIAVELRDERWTTVEAERTLVGAGVRRARRRRSRDTMAALLILQSFLDEQRQRAVNDS